MTLKATISLFKRKKIENYLEEYELERVNDIHVADLSAFAEELHGEGSRHSPRVSQVHLGTGILMF